MVPAGIEGMRCTPYISVLLETKSVGERWIRVTMIDIMTRVGS